MEHWKLEVCARAAHETLRVYRNAQGIGVPDWDVAEEWMRQSSRAMVERLVAGTLDVEAEHDAWMRERLAAGWTWGPERNDTAKKNPLLRPWRELTEGQRGATHAQVSVVRGLAAHLGLTDVFDDRCTSACPPGDRCTLDAGHGGGHNHRGCDCNEPNEEGG
jgi:hypothetical protein